VIARMMLNTGLDLLTGFVPLLGDLFDAAFKANMRNLALLERHARPGVPPDRSDYIFVGVCVVILVLLAVVPLALAWWLLSSISLY
jgi:hypothetical protein